MLSKVGDRVKRRSLQPPPIPITPIETFIRERLDCAPLLERWSDFSTPFPSIAIGGYTKYYKTYVFTQPSPTPKYCPCLSQLPQAPPSKEVPRTSSLFRGDTSLQRPLTIITEVSKESTPTPKTWNLSITTPTSPKSLRRRRRRLLRTPSVERDFALNIRQFFDPVMPTLPLETSLSHDSTLTSSTDSHSSQSDSNHSESNHSDSTHSESPVTPTTSVDGDGVNHVWQKDTGSCKDLIIIQRPDSRTSFNTARSSFDGELA